MKVLYSDRIFEGVGFSRNGAAAYRNGEKPMFMWPANSQLQETIRHHVEIYTNTPFKAAKPDRGCRRLYLMFYRLKP